MHSGLQSGPGSDARDQTTGAHRRFHDWTNPGDLSGRQKLYALRDVTGTVPSRPLIVASIMCKKLAENLDRLVLNVRFGKGAFMKTREKAEWLGESMLRVGETMGTKISYLLTAMEEPMGPTVGNALELAEAIDVLRGRGPADVINLVLDL